MKTVVAMGTTLGREGATLIWLGLLVTGLVVPVQSSVVSGTAKRQILSSYGNLPLHFEANQGQASDEVKFLYRGGNYSLFLTPSEALVALHKPEAEVEDGAERNAVAKGLRMRLLGANPSPQIVGLETLPGKSNYFIGKHPAAWHTNITTYGRVQYSDVYPGMDLVYYGNHQQVEYDFIVAPGTDPSAIRMVFEAVGKADSHIPLEIDTQGHLVLHIEEEEIRLLRPQIYQEIGGIRKPILGSYVLTPQIESLDLPSQVVGFQVATYDTSRALVIDPVLSYSTYLGGSGIRDAGLAVVVDASGNAYVTGVTNSSDFPTTPGSFQPTRPTPRTGGSGPAFVAKLNPSGSALIYSSYLGGDNRQVALGIGADAQGNAYVTGLTNSDDFPIVNASQPTRGNLGSADDAFVTKLNASGSALVYSTFLGGDQFDRGFGIAVAPSGDAYVTGSTFSTDFPISAGAFDQVCGTDANTCNAAHDVFVTKFDPFGARVYSTYLGGEREEEGRDIAVDASGNVYVMGETSSLTFPILNAVQPTWAGGGDVFVTKMNPFGSGLVYSTYLGGSGADVSLEMGIAVDTAGNAYVTGDTSSVDFPTVNAFQPVFGGGSVDAFVAKLDSSGSALVYSSYLGGSGVDNGREIAADAAGNAYLTGETSSTDFPTNDALQPTYGGGDFDAYAVKLDSAGTPIYSTYLGGNGTDGGRGIDVDASGNAFVIGATESPDFPTSDALQPFLDGGGDAFMTKIAPRTIELLLPAYGNPCCGSGQTMWNSLISLAQDANDHNLPIHLNVIFNPASGPGVTTDPNYYNPATPTNGHELVHLRNAGGSHLTVYGYVATTFAGKPPVNVKNEIDRYQTLYPDLVDGIFLDEMSTSPDEAEDYYHPIYNHIKQDTPTSSYLGGPVIGNPGTKTDEKYLLPATRSADTLVTFEEVGNKYLNNYSAHPWVDNYTPNHFAHLIHTQPTWDTAYLDLAIQRNVGMIYFTDDVLINPWDSLASYWANQVCAIQESNMPGSCNTPVPPGRRQRRGRSGGHHDGDDPRYHDLLRDQRVW